MYFSQVIKGKTVVSPVLVECLGKIVPKSVTAMELHAIMRMASVLAIQVKTTPAINCLLQQESKIPLSCLQPVKCSEVVIMYSVYCLVYFYHIFI